MMKNGKTEAGDIGVIDFNGGEDEVLDKEGWSSLARLLSSTSVLVRRIFCSKEDLKKARRNDLRTIFHQNDFLSLEYVKQWADPPFVGNVGRRSAPVTLGTLNLL